jgi:hypothetical protein
VAIVGHVDHQLVEHVIANPSVKHRNEALETGGVEVLCEELHLKVRSVHLRIILPWVSATL